MQTGHRRPALLKQPSDDRRTLAEALLDALRGPSGDDETGGAGQNIRTIRRDTGAVPRLC